MMRNMIGLGLGLALAVSTAASAFADGEQELIDAATARGIHNGQLRFLGYGPAPALGDDVAVLGDQTTDGLVDLEMTVHSATAKDDAMRRLFRAAE